MGASERCWFATTVGFALAGCSFVVHPDPRRLHEEVGAVDATMDTGAGCPLGCDDGVVCTIDTCESGGCSHVADPSQCPGGRCSLTSGCVSSACERDEECSDGNACNGAERCAPTGCVAGTPLTCTDGVACTTDTCDPTRGCVFQTRDELCNDGIACTMERCDARRGCTVEPDDRLCNDGCTTGASCQPGLGCRGGAPRDCDDGIACTVDGCAMGTCSNEPTPACEGTGESCANPRPLALVAGHGRTTIDLSSAGHDHATECSSRSIPGRDMVVTFLAEGGTALRIEASASIDTILAVSAGRCSTPALRQACNDDTNSPGEITSRLWLQRIPGTGPQRVYVLVGSYSRTTPPGRVELTVDVLPPQPEVCSDTAGLDLASGGSVVGTLGTTDHELGECGPDEAEIAFRYSGASHNQFLVWSSDAISLMAGATCDAVDACDASGSAASLGSTPRPVRHVWVQGRTGTSFRLDVDP